MLRAEDFNTVCRHFFAVGLVLLPCTGCADMHFKPTR